MQVNQTGEQRESCSIHTVPLTRSARGLVGLVSTTALQPYHYRVTAHHRETDKVIERNRDRQRKRQTDIPRQRDRNGERERADRQKERERGGGESERE